MPYINSYVSSQLYDILTDNEKNKHERRIQMKSTLMIIIMKFSHIPDLSLLIRQFLLYEVSSWVIIENDLRM